MIRRNELHSFLLPFCVQSSYMPEDWRVLYIGDSITDGNWGNNAKRQPSSQRNLWIQQISKKQLLQ